MRTSKSRNKTIAITLGDPFGIGPEVVAKALSKKSSYPKTNIIVIGDALIFNRYFKKHLAGCEFIDLNHQFKSSSKTGKATKDGAQASLNYLQKAVELFRAGQISALVTAPVCKETVCQIDPSFRGHTEYLAKALKTKHVEMMFVSPKLRTVIMTRHIPLKKVSRAINKTKILDTITLVDRSLKKMFSLRKPVIGVCGLNPHAGEAGVLGAEEIKYIIPAVKEARKRKINAVGPLAGDTIFTPSINQPHDAIIAMYHDQGLIPVKMNYFNQLVNLTLGLPIVRTSPAHGTAFNIAGKNKADPSSMLEAIKLASVLS